MKKIEFNKTNKKKRSNSLKIEKKIYFKDINENLYPSSINLRKSFEIYQNKNKNYKNILINMSIFSYSYFINNTNNNNQVYSYYNNTENPYFLKSLKKNKLEKEKLNKNKNYQSKREKIYNNENYDKKILKDKLRINIKKVNKNKIILEKKLQLKNNILLAFKLQIEKKNYETKLLNLKEQYKFVKEKYKKKLKSLKVKLIKCENDYIKMKIYEENLDKENLDFQNNKIQLLDSLIEYRRLLSDLNITNDENNEDYSYYIKDFSSEDKTIKESFYNENYKKDSIIGKESLYNEINNNDTIYKTFQNKKFVFRTKFLGDINKTK